MNQLPDILIIADEDTVYGVEHGYYPDLTKSVQDGNLMVLGYDNWRNNTDILLKERPLCKGEDVYIRNPYTNRYIKASDNELLDIFCEEKSLVIKEALVMMGAKHIIVEDNVFDKEQKNKGFKARLSNNAKGIGGSLNTSFSRTESLNIKNQIESEDPNRIPKSYHEVSDFMDNHGLNNDTKLCLLRDRLKRDGKLTGKEHYTLTYLNEINSALNVLSSIDYKIFSGSLDFSLEHNHIHSISKKLIIEF
ncbi:MAG: hypothetical protein IKM93_08090 [Bacteroidales bacterium]|nr:hypothetical protein [Bacteroidales bacterium]